MDNKRTGNKTRFHLGSRTIGNRDDHQRRIQHRSWHHQYRKTHPTIQRLLHAKAKHLPQGGDFFWAKQEDNETPEEHWRKLVSLEKNCEFKDIKQEDLLISTFITSITDKKLREKLIREKTLNLKTTMDLVTQDSYEKGGRK